MKRLRSTPTFVAAGATALVAAIVVAAAPVAADSGRVAADNPAWRTECGSCHVPYSPRHLPAAAWRKIMDGLDAHFGVDATVEPGTASAIAAFLDANASRGRKRSVEPASLRITDTPWFRHEHSGIAPAVWTRPGVRSAANCDACHPDATRGRYDERAVRVPR